MGPPLGALKGNSLDPAPQLFGGHEGPSPGPRGLDSGGGLGQSPGHIQKVDPA